MPQFSFSQRLLDSTPTFLNRRSTPLADEEQARIAAACRDRRRAADDVLIRRILGDACVIEVTRFAPAWQHGPMYRVVVLRPIGGGDWARTLRFRTRDYRNLAGVSRRVNRAWEYMQGRDADQAAGATAHHPAIRRRRNITTGAALRGLATPRIGQTPVPRGPRCPCCNLAVPTDGAFCPSCVEQGRDARGEL